jgi:hypothetical protein
VPTAVSLPQVEQSIKQLLMAKMQEQKNPNYTFLVDKRVRPSPCAFLPPFSCAQP